MEAPPTPVPPPDAAGSSSVPATASPIRVETCPAQDEAPNNSVPVEKGIDQNDTPSSVPPPN